MRRHSRRQPDILTFYPSRVIEAGDGVRNGAESKVTLARFVDRRSFRVLYGFLATAFSYPDAAVL